MKRKGICLFFVLLMLVTLAGLPVSANQVFAENSFSRDVTITGTNGENTTLKDIAYSDAFFERDSSDFVQELAQLSLAFSAASYGNTPDLAEKALSDFGFINDEVYDSESYQASAKEGKDSVGYSFASKKITINNKEYTLLAVIIRGTSGSNEWLSNFNINNTGDYALIHEGFSCAEKSLLADFNNYAASLHLNRSETKLLITGHSRGAAVANLLAADLSDTEQLADPANIYGYTFATPNVAKIEENTYPNIFNAVNPADIVTQIPLEKWGYSKYGINYVLSDVNAESTDELAAAQQLLSRFETIAPTVQDFYRNQLTLFFLQGDFVTTATAQAHQPGTYLDCLKRADTKKLSEQILDSQLKLLFAHTYA